MSFPISNSKTSRGFTLFELMITVGIFVFMTALMLARYNSFYSGTIFKNLAYDIALTIRQAQTYGISVKVDDSSNPYNVFTSAYGVRFDLNPGNTKRFSINTYNRNTNGEYSFKSNEKTYNLKQGAKISSVVIGGGIAAGNGLTIQETAPAIVDIIFQRPSPETIVCLQQVISFPLNCTSYKTAMVTIVASDGVTTHNVKVNGVGQITVE